MSFLRLRASTSLARTIFAPSSSSRLSAPSSPIQPQQISMLERMRSFSTTPVVEKMKSKRTLRLRVKPLAGGEFKRWKAAGSHGLTTLSSSQLRRLGEPTLVKTRMMKQTMKKMLPYSR